MHSRAVFIAGSLAEASDNPRALLRFFDIDGRQQQLEARRGDENKTAGLFPFPSAACFVLMTADGTERPLSLRNSGNHPIIDGGHS